jgi:hypothetical protein
MMALGVRECLGYSLVYSAHLREEHKGEDAALVHIFPRLI